MSSILSEMLCYITIMKEKIFSEVFYQLLKESGLNRKQFAERSGIPYPTVVGWTSMGRLPDFTALKKIADFFGCSVDYLMCRQDDAGNITVVRQLNEEERRLLDGYNLLSEEQKQAVKKLIESMRR